jgi:hypothetical protein
MGDGHDAMPLFSDRVGHHEGELASSRDNSYDFFLLGHV